MSFKKILATVMAATLVMSMSITAFADDNNGSSTGAGASEGHVEQKATNVVLPTVPTDGEGTVSPYRYTMDPERLIATTSAGRYENVVYPASADDKGVYFNNGKKGGDGADKDYVVYSGKSVDQVVTNKSSHSVDLTVTAEIEATEGDTDIPLVAQTALATADEASLYLGLVVGSGNTQTKTAIAADTAASKTVTLDGTAGNFKIAAKADKSGYEYRVLSLDEWKALDGNSDKTQDDYDATWKSTTFAVEGETTTGKSITDDTTAPKLKVTWSWEDPSVPTIALNAETYSRSNTANKFTISNIGDNTITGIKAYMDDGSEADPFASGSWSVNEAKTELTINGTKAPFGSGAVGKTRGVGLLLSNGTEIKCTFSVAQ